MSFSKILTVPLLLVAVVLGACGTQQHMRSIAFDAGDKVVMAGDMAAALTQVQVALQAAGFSETGSEKYGTKQYVFAVSAGELRSQSGNRGFTTGQLVRIVLEPLNGGAGSHAQPQVQAYVLVREQVGFSGSGADATAQRLMQALAAGG